MSCGLDMMGTAIGGNIEVTDVMSVVHPIGKGILSIFAPALANSIEEIEVNAGILETPASKKAKHDKAKVVAAMLTDAAAVTAVAKALVSTSSANTAIKNKQALDAKALADQAAAEAAISAEDAAWVGIPVSFLAQRLSPLQKGLADATTKLQKWPTDLNILQTQRAWQFVLNRVQNAPTMSVPIADSAVVPTTQAKPEEKKGSFMSLNMLGALPATPDNLEAIGLDASAFDWQKMAGGLVSTASTLAEGIQASDKAEKASASDKAKAAEAITADAKAAEAKATHLTSALLAGQTTGAGKATADARVAANQNMLDVASAAQDKAGAAVPASATALRVAAANKALAEAATKLQAEPMNINAQSLVKAWQWCITKVQNAQITTNAPDPGKKPPPTDPWYSKHIVGPVKVWHVGVGAGILMALFIAFKKGVFQRLGIG